MNKSRASAVAAAGTRKTRMSIASKTAAAATATATAAAASACLSPKSSATVVGKAPPVAKRTENDAQNRPTAPTVVGAAAAALGAKAAASDNEPRTPTSRKRRTADEDALTVEAYLMRECEHQVEQVLAHAEKRIAEFEREAKRVRSAMSELLEKT